MRVTIGVAGPLLAGAALLCAGVAFAQKAPATSVWVKDATTPPGSTSITFKAASPAASGTIGIVLAESGSMTEGTWTTAGKIVSVTLTGRPAFSCTLSGLSASSFAVAGCPIAGKYTKK
jgi:hypothetical protein